jgi:2-polyprenyl-3-methyl-5-hydroxy-6-metoxy-1,4-benzoquinol methylase
MKYDYDKYYKAEEYFGRPYQVLMDFFKDFNPKGSLLDLGCGQGRDSLALAEMGYDVTGIDMSGVGIRQMMDSALKQGISLKGMVGDIHEYEIDESYDVILLVSMLHFYKNDIITETKLVNKILVGMKPGGIFCNCMIKGHKREKILKSIIEKSDYGFTTLHEDYAEYPEYDSIYHILIIKKDGGK